jgi:hypothetical protein
VTAVTKNPLQTAYIRPSRVKDPIDRIAVSIRNAALPKSRLRKSISPNASPGGSNRRTTTRAT